MRFEYRGSDGIKTEPKGEVTIPAGSATFRVGFAPRVWFAPLTASELDGAQRVNGTIVLSKAVNTVLYERVLSQMKERSFADFN